MWSRRDPQLRSADFFNPMGMLAWLKYLKICTVHCCSFPICLCIKEWMLHVCIAERENRVLLLHLLMLPFSWLPFSCYLLCLWTDFWGSPKGIVWCSWLFAHSLWCSSTSTSWFSMLQLFILLKSFPQLKVWFFLSSYPPWDSCFFVGFPLTQCSLGCLASWNPNEWTAMSVSFCFHWVNVIFSSTFQLQSVLLAHGLGIHWFEL